MSKECPLKVYYEEFPKRNVLGKSIDFFSYSSYEELKKNIFKLSEKSSFEKVRLKKEDLFILKLEDYELEKLKSIWNEETFQYLYSHLMQKTPEKIRLIIKKVNQYPQFTQISSFISGDIKQDIKEEKKEDKKEDKKEIKKEEKKEDKKEEKKEIDNKKEDYSKSFSLLEDLTPIGENEIKKNEQYSCTECSSNIEITSIDESNNMISFKCPTHGAKSNKIKDYLKNMEKNTFFYNKCNYCGKQQNNINNNEIFNFCTICNIVICNKCIFSHDKNHLIIKNNKTKIICPLHPKNKNIIYCLDCNCHLCKECLKRRKHISHKKIYIEEIEPSYEEKNFLLKIINKYKSKMSNSEIEKNNKLVELENKYSEDKKKENDDYNKIIFTSKKELEDELTNCKNNYNYEIKEIKKKI